MPKLMLRSEVTSLLMLAIDPYYFRLLSRRPTRLEGSGGAGTLIGGAPHVQQIRNLFTVIVPLS